MKNWKYLALATVFLAACGSEEAVTVESIAEDLSQLEVIGEEVRDDHTLSNYYEVSVSHIHLNLSVDFEKQIVFGSAVHSVKNDKGATYAAFDTKNLTITGAQVDGEEAQYEIGERDELLGTPLMVSIPEGEHEVEIFYSTTDSTEALDWLQPAQTAGKKHPYLFTQGQAVLTRSWVPCMDTPGQRITYSADIQVPSELMAVMSANNPVEKSVDGKYHFEMNQPIPSYLMALAVGDLAFAPIDGRTGVYTEPEMIEACAAELADMGKMVDAAEALYGAYAWERYDVIVLPPSFPFGGMENPRLTFATPTIIAGDKSLTALIAHELAHSWSGNLVTNSTWDDFWLNEGFTVYFERRIMEEIYGKDYADMLAILGRQDLESALEVLSPRDQMLKLKMRGRNPDEGMTDIAYEKGCLFLKMLEGHVGREKFDAFLMDYFNTHKFQVLTTEDFVAHLEANLLEENHGVNVQEWVYESGLPANAPITVSENFNKVDQMYNAYFTMNDLNEIESDNWSTHEWLHFIRMLKPQTTSEQMAALDAKFELTNSGNSEIAAAWFEKSIKYGYRGIDEKLEEFLIRVGRRKFLTPLYGALAETEEGKARAIEIYKKARPGYHHVSISTLDAMLYSNS